MPINDYFSYRLQPGSDQRQRAAGLPRRSLPLQQLTDLPGIQYAFLTAPPVPRAGEFAKPTLTASHLRGFQALVLGGSRIGAVTFADGGDAALTFICRFAVGYDDLDLASCTQAGVAVSNIRGATSHHVASAALLMILALSKRLAHTGWKVINLLTCEPSNLLTLEQP
ncbi:MAG: hypothetical protein HY326_04430 [Chloroflexi bacterium]|nr:hypothetical protein [Chloroflexota bacterium]